MTQPAVNQVLLLRDPVTSKELGETLWAATKEVENFYNLGEQRVVFRRSYLSEVIPDGLRSGDITGAWPRLRNMIDSFFGGSAGERSQPDSSESTITHLPKDDPAWKKAEGQLVRTYDATKITHMVLELLGDSRTREFLIVVTDLLLTPPPDFRYIIWDGDDTGTVISIPPTDPKFWRMSEPDRIAIIKHRVRTAFLSAVGELIGLRRCDNERCFLLGDVSSVTCLDLMVFLGPEHDVAPLTRRGFEVFPNDPIKVQPVKENPEPEDRR
jgi:hypothetical protein